MAGLGFESWVETRLDGENEMVYLEDLGQADVSSGSKGLPRETLAGTFRSVFASVCVFP
jgi:hypothetical protein